MRLAYPTEECLEVQVSKLADNNSLGKGCQKESNMMKHWNYRHALIATNFTNQLLPSLKFHNEC